MIYKLNFLKFEVENSVNMSCKLNSECISVVSR